MNCDIDKIVKKILVVLRELERLNVKQVEFDRKSDEWQEISMNLSFCCPTFFHQMDLHYPKGKKINLVHSFLNFGHLLSNKEKKGLLAYLSGKLTLQQNKRKNHLKDKKESERKEKWYNNKIIPRMKELICKEWEISIAITTAIAHSVPTIPVIKIKYYSNNNGSSYSKQIQYGTCFLSPTNSEENEDNNDGDYPKYQRHPNIVFPNVDPSEESRDFLIINGPKKFLKIGDIVYDFQLRQYKGKSLCDVYFSSAHESFSNNRCYYYYYYVISNTHWILSNVCFSYLPVDITKIILTYIEIPEHYFHLFSY